MSETPTDLVIQISTSEPGSGGASSNGEKADESRVVNELRKCLQPGVEIALVFRGYTAITSIVWLSGPLPDRSVRAGVRLLGISALPATEHTGQTDGSNEARPSGLPVLLGARTGTSVS